MMFEFETMFTDKHVKMLGDFTEWDFPNSDWLFPRVSINDDDTLLFCNLHSSTALFNKADFINIPSLSGKWGLSSLVYFAKVWFDFTVFIFFKSRESHTLCINSQ